MSTEERFTELEVRYAHLEKVVQELSEVLIRQQRELDALKDGFKRVQERLGAGEPGLVDASRQDQPPHY